MPSAQIVIDVEIEGTAPLLQNNIEGAEGVGNLPKSNKRKTGGIKDNPDEWQFKTYKDDKGNLCHPGSALESALVRAGRDFKADKRRSMSDVLKALVFVNEPLIQLDGKKKPDCVNRASVVNPNTKGRGFVYRPQFNTGWIGKCSITIADAEMVDVDQVKEILDHAGKRIGIGDWRPKFGRFFVRKFITRK